MYWADGGPQGDGDPCPGCLSCLGLSTSIHLSCLKFREGARSSGHQRNITLLKGNDILEGLEEIPVQVALAAITNYHEWLKKQNLFSVLEGRV